MTITRRQGYQKQLAIQRQMGTNTFSVLKTLGLSITIEIE